MFCLGKLPGCFFFHLGRPPTSGRLCRLHDWLRQIEDQILQDFIRLSSMIFFYATVGTLLKQHHQEVKFVLNKNRCHQSWLLTPCIYNETERKKKD